MKNGLADIVVRGKKLTICRLGIGKEILTIMNQPKKR
jgi:hypothetical protein